MKMRKIVAALMAVLMLCCLIPFAAVAEDASAVIDFTDKANRTHYSTEQQVWEQNGIVVTNDKGASTSNVGDYGGDGYPARFYKSSTVKIEYPGMTKIVIDCTGLDAKYVNGWADSFSANATATVENNIVTIVLAEAADSFVWETMSAQSRAYNIAVYGAAAQPDVPAEPVSYEADFDTIVTTNANGDSSYNKTFTTEAGWVTENSAIQTGGATVMNPQFPVIGEDSSSKAVCMNGKVSAPGKISSPVLSGGINKLTINYTKMFTDTALGMSISITDIATGEVYTATESREVSASDDKYVIWTFEWVLDTPIAGDFTIELLNTCPSQATGNKDRLTVLDIVWETTGSGSVTPPVEPDEPDVPDVPVEPDVPASDLILIDAPKAGVAYKFGMIQGNVSATDVYYLIGGMAQTYYMATGTDAAAAVDVYLEETTGGYYMYAMINGAKTYINMVVSTTHVNGAYSDTASTVYTYDADAKTVIAMMQPDGADAPAAYWFGTRNDKQYTTVGPCAVEYAGFYCQFYGAAETPDEPDVPAEDKLTIEEAIALGQTMEHNTFTEKKYYVTGVITEVYNEMYGNMRLTDAAGNILTIYGTWSADGALRYDALDVKPVAGDTVTVYGIVGQYNGTSQVKNGWIVAHVAGETPDEPVEPDTPVEPDEPAVEVEIATELKEGVAYKLAMNQLEKGALYYFIGTMSTYYGATETDISLAVDMYVEIVDGGYKLYFNDANGGKQYIALVQSGTHYNFTFGSDASVFSWDAERNALYATAGDMVCYMGTYGTYVTVGTLKQDMLSDSDYIARLYVEKSVTPDEPVNPDEPGTDEPSEPDTPDEPGTDSPATGDNTTVYVTLAVVLMALAAAAAVITSKKRA